MNFAFARRGAGLAVCARGGAFRRPACSSPERLAGPTEALAAEDLSILRELLGPSFLTPGYPIKAAVFLKDL